jgi:hypothetical protein
MIILYLLYYILAYMGKKLRQERRKMITDKDMTELRQKKRIRETRENLEKEIK